jgi:hypothetical protein
VKHRDVERALVLVESAMRSANNVEARIYVAEVAVRAVIDNEQIFIAKPGTIMPDPNRQKERLCI